MKITFIGLGIMGSRMASNLIQHGADLTVYNRSKAAIEPLVLAGAKTADTAQLAVQEADIVFSMLSTPEVVKAIFFGREGALANMKTEALWVDCTTVNPSFTAEAAAEAKLHGVDFMDAPVAGTKPHAEKAELAFFVGGRADQLEQIRPYLEQMGNKIMHAGETGKGAAFKMLVNIMLAQSMLIFSEATILGEKLGFTKDFLLNTLPNLVVSAPFTKFKAEMVRQDDYEVQFPLEWMHKDLHLAAVTAYELNQPLYLANVTKEIYAEARRKGMGRLDFAAIHRFLEEQAQSKA
ncbi:MAG: NAD(P)-dependent oxidoreductase [Saprospiraceae bacterium]|nr:NAD(P)-dependent oxidoreductase [Saprospiraceae bacterium]